MMELPLVFMAGALGSAHCVGMCGGFALMIGANSAGAMYNLGRQLVYSLGRLFTYVFLGLVCVHAGQRLAAWSSSAIWISAGLAIVAGCFLLFQAGSIFLIWPRRWTGSGGTPCLAGGFVGTFLRAPGLTNAFLAGILTGFLPCGLLYGMLALAASTASLSQGALTMAVFASGTMPLMVATGLGGSLLGVSLRRRVYLVAGFCVLLAGVVSVARGVTALRHLPGENPAAACPLCR
jgi:sulfite exporter TauE/SafE